MWYGDQALRSLCKRQMRKSRVKILFWALKSPMATNDNFRKTPALTQRPNFWRKQLLLVRRREWTSWRQAHLRFGHRRSIFQRVGEDFPLPFHRKELEMIAVLKDFYFLGHFVFFLKKPQVLCSLLMRICAFKCPDFIQTKIWKADQLLFCAVQHSPPCWLVFQSCCRREWLN